MKRILFACLILPKVFGIEDIKLAIENSLADLNLNSNGVIEAIDKLKEETRDYISERIIGAIDVELFLNKLTSCASASGSTQLGYTEEDLIVDQWKRGFQFPSTLCDNDKIGE